MIIWLNLEELEDESEKEMWWGEEVALQCKKNIWTAATSSSDHVHEVQTLEDPLFILIHLYCMFDCVYTRRLAALWDQLNYADVI